MKRKIDKRILLFIIALITMCFLHVDAHAGKQPDKQRYDIRISYKDTTLRYVTDAITRQVGIVFSYDNSISSHHMPASNINLKRVPVERLLEEFFTPAGITFNVVNDVVILQKMAPDTPALTKIKHLVSGTVRDADGQPLAGVSVYISGTDIGTFTDYDGHYELPAAANDIIRYSFVGFAGTTEPAGTKNHIDVVLNEQQYSMDEVVVIGYGTSKKRDILGSIETLSRDQIANRPNVNVVRSLQGMIPGLNIIQTDGKLTHSGKITIRGVDNSFNARVTDGQRSNTLGQGGEVLVLIDGAEGDMTALNPEDIASITVLKDAASAAVYGARGAFGVILITTRNPEMGKTTVTYDGSVSLIGRTIQWEDNVVTDPVEWVEAWRESYMNSSPAAMVPSKFNNYMPYSDKWFSELKRKKSVGDMTTCEVNPDGNYAYYGQTNWLSEIYRETNMATSHSVTVQSGKKDANWYVSGRYYGHNGIYKVGDEKYRRYNFRAKGSVKIRPWMALSNNISFMKSTYHQPMVNNQQMITRQLDLYAYPFAILRNPDGTWTETAVRSGYTSFAEGTSWQENSKMTISSTSALTLDIIRNRLKLSADFTYRAGRHVRDKMENKYTYWSGTDVSGTDKASSSLENKTYKTDYISTSVVGTLTPGLGRHNRLSIMAGWNLEDYVQKTAKTYRQGNLYPSKPSFTLMDGDYYSTESGGKSWGLVGFFTRVDYALKDRYMAEFSARYDGSSKFPTRSKWGFFPSVSAGWRISDEPWIRSCSGQCLSNLKLRVSVGSLGNANIDPYQYLETMRATGSSSVANTTIVLNGMRVPYTSVPNLVPDNMTWEKVTTYNIGMDLSMFADKFSFTADLYRRRTTDLYTVGPDLPHVLGSSAPSGNYASLKTSGWELSADWHDSMRLSGKRFSYSVKAMLWDSRSYVTSYYNATGDLTTYYKGMEIGEIWGFKTDGIYASNAEAEAGPSYSFFKNGEMFRAYAGDLKFVDLDGDGKMSVGNRTLSDHGDLTIIGNQSPRLQYSFGISLNWNGIGLSMLWQGVGKRDWYPWTESGFFWGKWNRAYNALMKSQTGDNRVKVDKSSDNWIVTNMDKRPYWTRMVSLAANRNNGPLTWENDHYLQDASYIRLKNLTMDYTFPLAMCRRIGLSGLKLYFTGENLFTWSPMFRHTDMFDPEVISSGDSDFENTLTPGLGKTGNGYSYPMLKTYTFGINLTF